MLKINRKVEYGLVALKHMASKPKGQLASAREICNAYKTPFDPLAHVLRILNANGVLKSEQGARGGYRLVRDLEDVSLAEFIRMVDGELAWTDCSRGENGCKCDLVDTCNIVLPMQGFNDRLMGFLQSISIAELLGTNGFSGFQLNSGESQGSASSSE